MVDHVDVYLYGVYLVRMSDDFFFFKQKTAYEMRISDWSSDVCSSDLQFLKVRLFRFRYDDRSTEQRVAQAVTLTRPCYPIIDDVGIYGAIFPNLTNLYPTILG